MILSSIYVEMCVYRVGKGTMRKASEIEPL